MDEKDIQRKADLLMFIVGILIIILFIIALN